MADRKIESVNHDLDALMEAVGNVMEAVSGSEGLDRSRLRRHRSGGESTAISGELSSLRRSLQPLDTESGITPERLPLAPTSGNPNGEEGGRWRSPLAPERRSKNVTQWQAEFPRHTVVLYPFQKPLPKDFQWPTRLA